MSIKLQVDKQKSTDQLYTNGIYVNVADYDTLIPLSKRRQKNFVTLKGLLFFLMFVSTYFSF